MSTLTFNSQTVDYGNGSTALNVNSVNVNLTAATAYYTNVTVYSGYTLSISRTCDFRVSGTLTVNAGGIIKNYNNGSNTGGSGASGHDGGGGGAGGSATGLTYFTDALSASYGGGPGGGSGAGGGGAGGDGFKIIAKNIVNNGTIACNGSKGTDGYHWNATNEFSATFDSVGGAGGGGGGSVITICEVFSGNGIVNVSGGAGGNGVDYSGEIGGNDRSTRSSGGSPGASGTFISYVGQLLFSGTIYGFTTSIGITYVPDSPIIQFDRQGQNYTMQLTGSEVTRSLNIADNPNRFLLVIVKKKGAITGPGLLLNRSSVTFGGVPLTYFEDNWTNRTSLSVPPLRVEYFYMINPPIGYNDVVVTRDVPATYVAFEAISYFNVHQSHPIKAFSAMQYDSTTVFTARIPAVFSKDFLIATLLVPIGSAGMPSATIIASPQTIANGGNNLAYPQSGVAGNSTAETFLHYCNSTKFASSDNFDEMSFYSTQATHGIVSVVALRTANEDPNLSLAAATYSALPSNNRAYLLSNGLFHKGSYLKVLAKNITANTITTYGCVVFKCTATFDLNNKLIDVRGFAGGTRTTAAVGTGGAGYGYHELSNSAYGAPNGTSWTAAVYGRTVGGVGAYTPSPSKYSGGFPGASSQSYSYGKGGGGGANYGYGGTGGNVSDQNRGQGGGGGYEFSSAYFSSIDHLFTRMLTRVGYEFQGILSTTTFSDPIYNHGYSVSYTTSGGTFPRPVGCMILGGGGGGGGGGGDQTGVGATSGAGGDGGGAIHIDADIFYGGGVIDAGGRDGESCPVASNMGGGGGGGGAGGIIVITARTMNAKNTTDSGRSAISDYELSYAQVSGPIGSMQSAIFSVKGGNGGNTYRTAGSGASGGGGGGGGGTIYIGTKNAPNGTGRVYFAGGTAGSDGATTGSTIPSTNGGTGIYNLIFWPKYTPWSTSSSSIIWF